MEQLAKITEIAMFVYAHNFIQEQTVNYVKKNQFDFFFLKFYYKLK
jgi:hypothetical protein